MKWLPEKPNRYTWRELRGRLLGNLVITLAIMLSGIAYGWLVFNRYG